MNVVIKPIISEKMTMVGEKYNRYGFIVDRKATKPQIKKEIEELYGVKVLQVNTLIQRGKSTSQGRHDPRSEEHLQESHDLRQQGR